MSCTTTADAVLLSGEGWPAAARCAIRSSLRAVPLSGTVRADGSSAVSFVAQAVLPGDDQFQASSGSLLAPRSCILALSAL